MKHLRGVAALYALVMASPALAFVQSVALDTNKPLAWKNPQVTFLINPNHFNSTPGCVTKDAAMALARASIPTWNGAKHPGDSKICTSFQFVDGGDTTSTALGYDQTAGATNENLVVFRSGLCTAQTGEPLCTTPPLDKNNVPDYGPCVQRTNCWEHDATSGAGGIIALTTVTYDSSTGEILDADMELHDWNGSTISPDGMYFTCAPPEAGTCSDPGYSQSGCVYWDVGNTVTHEAGHMLGLDHCAVGGSGATACPNTGTPSTPEYPVMAPTATFGDTDKRTLKPDDIDGVCTIYPVKDTGGGCGCGTASASGLALLGLFLAALRPRRRSAQ